MSGWLLLAALACVDSVPVGPREGMRVPALDGAAVDGRNVDVPDGQHRPAVVVFWATWCGPCRAEIPDLRQLLADYGDRIELVGVNAGEPVATVSAATGPLGITWPVLSDTDRHAQAAFQIEALPTVLIVDGEGLVRYRGFGLPADPHPLLDGLLAR